MENKRNIACMMAPSRQYGSGVTVVMFQPAIMNPLLCVQTGKGQIRLQLLPAFIWIVSGTLMQVSCIC